MVKSKNIKNVLVTGASGMLGFEVARFFANQGVNVVGLFYKNPILVNKNIKNILCDIGDNRSVGVLIKKIGKLDLIVHCASMTGVDKCEEDKERCFKTNVIGTRNMLALASKYEAKIIYISTGSVFSGEKGNYKEEDIPDPKNYYSFTKALGEEAVLSYHKGIVIRTTPIGLHPKGRSQTNFIEWIVDKIKKNEPLNFFTDVYINALSAHSLASILFEVPKMMSSGLLHLGSKDHLSKADIGMIVLGQFKDYLGKVKLVSIDSVSSDFATRPKEMWLNIDKAKTMGFKISKLEDEVIATLT